MRMTPRRWWIVAAIIVAATIVAGVIAFAIAQGPPDALEPNGSAPTSASASPSPEGEATAPAPSPGDDGEPPVTGAPVPIGDEATADDGVVAVITGVTSFTAEAGGVGEVGGDALRVTITLTNTADAARSLGAVTVNLEYGANATPGSPIFSDPSVVEFGGELAPGESRSGTYVFAVPSGEQGSVTVTVSHAPASPPFVFTR